MTAKLNLMIIET